MSQSDVKRYDAAERLAALAGNLYTLPAVALEILDLVDRVDTDAIALRRCVEKDPALAAKILRVVNSSLYGPSQPIGDLGQALAFLGAKPLKLLVLGFSLPPRMFQGVEAKVLTYYWRHTLTKAVTARELSDQLIRASSEECFLAGLLQDIGLLVFIQSLGSPFQRFVEKVCEKREDLYVREQEVFGFDHRTISAKLLRHWGMPPAIVEMIDQEELTRPSAGVSLAAKRKILQGAEAAAKILADERPEEWPRWEQFVTQLRGTSTGPTAEELLKDIHHKVKQLAEVLSLRLPAGQSYEKILELAHNKLAKVSEEVAGLMLTRTEQKSDAFNKMGAQRSGEAEELHRALMLCLEAPSWAQFPRPVDNGEKDASDSRSWDEHPPAAGWRTEAGWENRGQALTTKMVLQDTTRMADPGLLGHLRAAVAYCRANRCGVSLLLADYHDAANLLLVLGKESYSRLQQFLIAACSQLDHPDSVCLPHGDTGCAWILPDCERETAVLYGHQLIRTVNSLRVSNQASFSAVLGIGIAFVATPAPNFPAEDLLSAAERCLFGSLASAGGVVKSIEIY